MSKRKKNRRQTRPAAVRRPYSEETRAGDAVTVAWIVSVMMALMCDVGAAGAHWWSAGEANARSTLLLREMLLFSAAVVGFISLVLLPIMLKVRRAAPPNGLVVFAICVTAAPILALLIQATH
jgi:hypothetical protein